MERNVEIDKISDGKRYGANDLVKVGCDDCRGCSACCNGMGDSIVLDPMDVYRLEKKLGKTMEEILLAGNVALRVVDGVILPHLKMTEQSDQCSFLNEEGRCSIHDARPGFCRMFPLGRLYEDGTFSYFLQVNECPKENKTKVKVRRWLDTPELGKYEAFTTEWHYYLKKKQNAARESEDDAFRQKRAGRNGTYFYIYKFRTMRMDTPHDMPTHMLNNPDLFITRVGRFLRKTSLDELPQLFNILKGDMALVGPRPALWNQDDLLAERERYGANSVRPGLTGWAQIHGRDELPIRQKAELDGYYVHHIQLKMDLECLWKTAGAVLRQDGIHEGRLEKQQMQGAKEAVKVGK